MSSLPLLATPGPTNVSKDVLSKVLTGNINQKSMQFREALKETNRLVPQSLGLRETHNSVVLSTSGTGALEVICNHLRKPVLVLSNGRYAQRTLNILKGLSHDVEVVNFNWRRPISSSELSEIPQRLLIGRDLFFVHQETQTGIVNDLEAIFEFSNSTGSNVHCDAMSMAFAFDYSIYAKKLGFLAASANKCLESIPGVAFVLSPFENDTVPDPKNGITRNLHLQLEQQRNGRFPHTPPVGVVLAARQALIRLKQETLGSKIVRYNKMTEYVRNRLVNEGLVLSSDFSFMHSPCVSLVELPTRLGQRVMQLNETEIRKRNVFFYTDDEMLEMGIFSIATMGAITFQELEKLVSEFLFRVSKADQ